MPMPCTWNGGTSQIDLLAEPLAILEEKRRKLEKIENELMSLEVEKNELTQFLTDNESKRLEEIKGKLMSLEVEKNKLTQFLTDNKSKRLEKIKEKFLTIGITNEEIAEAIQRRQEEKKASAHFMNSIFQDRSW